MGIILICIEFSMFWFLILIDVSRQSFRIFILKFKK